MQKQIKNPYLKALYKYFEQHKNEIFFFNTENRITEATIKDLFKIRKNEVEEEVDKEIIKIFEKEKGGQTQPFKVISNFLNQRTYGINEDIYTNLLAFLLDFSPRPKDTFYSRKNMQPEKDVPPPEIQEHETAKDAKPEQHKPKKSLEINKELPKSKETKFKTNVATKLEQLGVEFPPIPQKSTIHKKQLTGFQKIFIALIVIIALLAAILFTGLFSTKKTKTMDTQINAGQIHIENKYYYYKDSNGIKLTEKPLVEKNTQAVTPVVLNRYLVEQGYDTTQKDIQLIKAAYFKNYRVAPQRELQLVGRESDEKPVQNQGVAHKKLEKSFIKITSKGKTDHSVADIIKSLSLHNNVKKVVAKTIYSYKNSKIVSGHKICKIQLDGVLQNGKDLQNINLQVTGNGTDSLSARNNALMKLKLLIKDKIK